MGRISKILINMTVTSAGGNNDLVSILPGDDKPCSIAGWIFGVPSEVGDAAEEGIHLSLIHMTATITNGTGGSAPSPAGVPLPGDPAVGYTSRINDTGVATTSGTATTHEELAWINRNTPWERYIPPEHRVKARQTEGLFLRMNTTLADDMTLVGTVFIEED